MTWSRKQTSFSVQIDDPCVKNISFQPSTDTHISHLARWKQHNARTRVIVASEAQETVGHDQSRFNVGKSRSRVGHRSARRPSRCQVQHEPGRNGRNSRTLLNLKASYNMQWH